MPSDEQDEIKRSLDGDLEAFESLVRRYQKMIFALTYRMSGSLTEAEDLTQEVFIRAHRELSGFRAEAKFSSWLYRIAMNRCLNWRERRARQERIHSDWEMERLHEAAATAAGNSVHWEQVHHALRQLHPKQRAAIVLTTYEGLN